MKTPENEIPNGHLAAIHANDAKDVVKEQLESAEAKRLEETKVQAGDNSFLAARHAGLIDENGESLETVNVDDLPTHVGGIKIEHEFDADPSKDAPVFDEPKTGSGE
jgi:hypothetical protein